MESFYQNAINTFVERSKEKLFSLHAKFNKNADFFDNPENSEESYHVIKQIRDGSAVFRIKEIYDITSHLLKHFKIDGLNYELPLDKKQIVIEGFGILAKIFFTLETDQELAATTTNPIQLGKNTKNIKILIVDEDQFFTEWLNDNLITTEVELITTKTDSIISFIVTEKIDLILIDMSTPNNNGFKVVKEIREHDWVSSFPIFAITNSKSEQHHIEIIESGVDDIISKPFNISFLLTKVRNFIKRKKDIQKTDYFNKISNQSEEVLELLQKEWVRFQRFQSYFSLLFIKLDMYEKLVETYGINPVINYMFQFYHLVSKSIRTYDEIKGWDTDSFIVLLPATRLEGAVLVGNRLKDITKKVESEIDFSSNILIGAVESDLDYREAKKMIIQVKKELISTTSISDVHQVAPLSRSIDDNTKKRRLKVLIIDDDPVPLTILQNHFKEEVWEVEICSEGEQAFDKVLQIKPDFIIGETKMKNLDGYSFCYQIRQFPLYKDTIFIFLSRQSITKQIVRGFQVGADDYITKPFSVQEVEARMLRLWNRRG